MHFHGAQTSVSETVGVQAHDVIQSEDASTILWRMSDKNTFPGNVLSGSGASQMFPEQLLVVLFCSR